MRSPLQRSGSKRYSLEFHPFGGCVEHTIQTVDMSWGAGGMGHPSKASIGRAQLAGWPVARAEPFPFERVVLAGPQLTGWPAQWAVAENVEVEVEDGLARAGSVVDHDAVVFEAGIRGDLICDEQQVAE